MKPLNCVIRLLITGQWLLILMQAITTSNCSIFGVETLTTRSSHTTHLESGTRIYQSQFDARDFHFTYLKFWIRVVVVSTRTLTCAENAQSQP